MTEPNDDLLPANRRRNIRFRTRVPEIINLNFPDREGYQDIYFPAIKIDENIRCVSCVLVTPFDLNDGDTIIFKENDGFHTPSEVIRAQEIEATLFKIVFQYIEPPK